MPVSYNFKKGVDLPSWHWLNQLNAATVAGFASAFDGKRYIYYVIAGATGGGIWRFDTFTNAWQLMSTNTVAVNCDVEYDATRNVLWFTIGNTTAWFLFNLNATPLTIGGQTVQPFAVSTAISVVLPAIPAVGSSLFMLDDNVSPAPLDGSGSASGAVTGASTATSVVDATSEFQAGLVGCYVRFTSGSLAGQQRCITAVPDANTLTVNAFGSAPAVGDTYVVDMPGGAVPLATTSATTTTLTNPDTWTANIYRDADVVIVAGTGAGQRRRIASNTATALTLAAAVAGNPRTGPFTTTPDATSTFRIVPSTDFVYYQGGPVTFYRCDVAATTFAWVAYPVNLPAALGAGANSMPSVSWAPFSIVTARGSGTATVYRIDVGLQTIATLPSAWGAETLGAGGTVTRAWNRTRMLVHVGGTQRIYLLNVVTGILEPIPQPPYAVPSAVDGKRLRWLRTADGVDWIYWQRNGGQEFFRIPAEWL